MNNSVTAQNFSTFIQQNTDKNVFMPFLKKYNTNPEKPTLDKLIRGSNELKKQQENQKPSFFQKLFRHPTLSITPLLPLNIGIIYLLVKGAKLLSKIKKPSIPKKMIKKEFKELLIKGSKQLMALAALAPVLYFAMDFLNKKNKNKHFDKAAKIVNDFNRENNSDVKFVEQPIDSSMIGAMADPFSGRIILGEQFNNDMILANTHQKHFLNHELVHMKQYMLIARSKDGIEKLNYLVLKRLANKIDKNEIYNAYQETKSGLTENYKNATMDRFGYKINMVDFVTAMYKIIFEKDTTYKDIPIVINEDFYRQHKNSKGELSEKEEKKAQQYLEAYENYPAKIDFLQLYNPLSEYRQNLLEKEAYKMNPWYTL